MVEYTEASWPSSWEATRLAASISSRTDCCVLWTSAAISTTTKAALRAEMTRFNCVLSFIAAWYQGRRMTPRRRRLPRGRDGS